MLASMLSWIPITGHRSFCRWGCPWSATWGILNLVGFYKIKADVDKCIDCGLCERECDEVFKSHNLNPLERNIRLAGGLTLTGLVFMNPSSPWGYIGLAFFFTGLFGFGHKEDAIKPPNITVGDRVLGSDVSIEDIEKVILEKKGG